MLQAINIRYQGNAKHRAVLAAAEELAKNSDYGSGVNALLVMVRRSPLYAEAMRAIEDRQRAAAKTPEEP